MGLALRDSAQHTYGDYLAWPEDVRYELIEGIAYLMAPAPTPRHQHFAGGIYVQLYNQLGDSACQVLIAPVDVVLPRAAEADERTDTVVQPDVQELKGETTVGVLSGVAIQWDALVARLPAIDD